MAKHNPLPPLARLHELLHYDPQEGVLRWRDAAPRNRGREAGSLKADGYMRVQIDGRRYYAHRIAYYMGTGIDPQHYQIDHHPDPTRTNNKLDNLRLSINTADNCATRTHKHTRTQPVVIAYADGLLLQCASQGIAARTLGLNRETIRRHLHSGTPTDMGHRLYAYPSR